MLLTFVDNIAAHNLPQLASIVALTDGPSVPHPSMDCVFKRCLEPGYSNRMDHLDQLLHQTLPHAHPSQDSQVLLRGV